MFSTKAVAFLLFLDGGARADKFNYRSTKGNDYGPAQWNKVECDGLDDCVSSKSKSWNGWKVDDILCGHKIYTQDVQSSQ